MMAGFPRRCTFLPLSVGTAQAHAAAMVIFLLVWLVLLAVLAPRWGADTRDGRDWQPGSWVPGPLRTGRPC